VAVAHERVRAVADGEGGLILVEVEGEAGTGKSRLLFDAIVAATTLGVEVAAASANEQEQLVPFSPLATIFPGSLERGAAGSGARRLSLGRLRTELEERAAKSPLLVVLDDWQWADSATVMAVRTLALELASYPVLWKLAGRLDESAPRFEQTYALLASAVAPARIRLGSLSPAAVAGVIADAVGAEPDGQLVAFGRGRSRFGPVVFYGRCRRGARRAIGGDVAGVPGGTRRRRAGPAERGLGLSPRPDPRRCVPGTGGAGPLVAAPQDRWAVAGSGRVALPAARHLSLGAQPGDSVALTGLDQAVHEVLTLAPRSGADLALRALQLTEPSDDARFARTHVAVDALMAARRPDEALALVRSGLTSPGLPAEAKARLQLKLSFISLVGGRPAETVLGAEAVLLLSGLSDEFYDEAEVAALLGALGEGKFRLARQRAEAILAGTARPGGDAALTGALTALSFVAWDEGRVVAAVGLLRAAVRRSERGPRGSLCIFPRLSLAALLTALGDFDKASELIAATSDEFDVVETAEWSAAVPMTWARLHLAVGRLDEAAANAEFGLALAEEMGTRTLIPIGEWVLACVALYSGDLDEAAGHVARYRADLPLIRGTVGSATYVLTEAWLADAQHGPTRALQVLGPLYRDMALHKHLLVADPTVVTFMVRNALAVGDHQRAENATVQAERLAADNPDFSTLAAAADHARGLVNGDRSALERAVTAHRHPWAGASAGEDLGTLLTATDRKASRVRLEQTVAAYDQMGAVRDAVRVRDRLHRLDGRPHRSQPRPVVGWGSLTETERRVADLVALGLTNNQVATRMFLSRHTVDYHLRQIFRKLQLRSRVGLARATLQRDA
jgi:DNA-binding CsgD family transcriptional regulator